jgi:3-hydroxyisobutyrate dehydrogenase-like beta-hydroxyacid dehydrogenase
MRIGWVGAGRMGRPMARRLVAAGHDVAVLGRSAAARTDLAGEGLRAVGDLAAVADGAAAVVVCVFTDEQVRAVCLDGPLLDAMTPGSVLVVHTTGSPRTADALAERAGARGVAVVDAPVSGGPHDVAAGRLTLFVGGDDPAVARVRAALSAYADPVLHVGPLGAGQQVKLLNNALFAAHIGLLREAARLGARWGLPEPVLLEALPHGSAASRALAGVADRGSVAGFAAAIGEFLGKDVDNVRKAAADLGGDLGAIEHAVHAALGTTDH